MAGRGHERGPERAIALDDHLAWAISAAQSAPAAEGRAAVRDGHERHVCTGLSGGVAGSAAVEAERLGAHRTLPLMRTEMVYAAEPPSPPVPASPLLPPPSVPPPPAPDPPPAVLPMLDPQALDRSTASVAETRRPSVMTSPAHERAPTTTSTSWGPNA